MVSKKYLEYLTNNLFLPPKLPQQDDKECGAAALFQLLYDDSCAYAQNLASTEYEEWRKISENICTWRDVYDNGTPCSEKITTAISKMRENDSLLLYLTCQNAAVLLRKKAVGTIFECFEVSPKTEAVLKAKDALLRSFPARAVLLPKSEMDSIAFTDMLGSALHKLTIESTKLSMEKTKKGNNTVVEVRQSAHPRLVTEWLFSVLASRGSAISTSVINKRTHDDVCWYNADKPWRRSGVWLSVRVALHLILHGSDEIENADAHYKNFILFTLARLGHTIAAARTSSDVLHSIRVKLARRCAKLGDNVFPFVRDVVSNALSRVNRFLVSQWAQVVQRDNFQLRRIPIDELHPHLTLQHSHVVLQEMWRRSKRQTKSSVTHFTPPTSSRLVLKTSQLPPSNIFDASDSNDLLHVLVAFEDWVTDSLSTSIQTRSDKNLNSTCQALQTLLVKYHKSASVHYKDNPERLSVMLLTLGELWVAIDSVATKLCPLLLQYSPEIPSTLFEPLLLSKRQNMQRLQTIEQYLHYRYEGRNAAFPSVFDKLQRQSFSVQFYESSVQLQGLCQSIENAAQRQREFLSRKWKQQKAEYDRLLEEAERMPHERFLMYWLQHPKTKHDRYCQKCAKEKTAKAMEAEKHEWPLPEDEIERKAVVFELQPPEYFISWRDATWHMIHDIGRNQQTSDLEAKQILTDYHALQNFSNGLRPRIALASSVKSFTKAHYFKSGLELDDIFVDHGMRYELYDTSKSSIWTAQQTGPVSLRKYCRSGMPAGLYTTLVQEVNGTEHAQNAVIARQSQCSLELSPQEFINFASVRSGERLQWMHVLACLLARNVNINTPSATTLFTQLTAQAGSSTVTSSLYRESHSDLERSSFCSQLLDAIASILRSIKANWKEIHSAEVLLLIAHRLASMAPDDAVHHRALEIVYEIRQMALTWLRALVSLCRAERGTLMPGNSFESSCRVLRAALLVRRTWDMDSMDCTLHLSSTDDVADFIEASIYVHDYALYAEATTKAEFNTSILNDRTMAVKLEHCFRNIFQSHSGAISEGIARFWQSANFTSQWRLVNQQDPSWFQNTTQGGKTIHYNIGSGSLLVSGLPLSRLPDNYTKHKTYRSMFGDRVLDVFVSEDTNMEYTAVESFGGHKVYFRLNDDDLIIRVKKNSTTYELVPQNTFDEDLPKLFIQNKLMFMDLGNCNIYVRDPQQFWLSHENEWMLHFDPRTPDRSSLRRQRDYIVDLTSSVGNAIKLAFQYFERPEYIHIFFIDSKSRVEIQLPRYRLNFYVDETGMVYCRELSAVIQLDQGIGTFHGLESRLVLRAFRESKYHISEGALTRYVLVPNGVIRTSTKQPHTKVTVDVGDEPTAAFFKYRIDTKLGRLVADGDLEAHLYRIHLHAVTSFILEDSLTHRTGTEEALLGLSDSISRRSIPLTPECRRILMNIAGLTAKRDFYPPNLATMQSVSWDDGLSPWSQHNLFFGTVQQIILHNSKTSALFDAEAIPLPTYRGSLTLLNRAVCKSRKYYPLESVISDPELPHDDLYFPRDQITSPNQQVSYEVACLAAGSSRQYSVKTTLYDMMAKWGNVEGFSDPLQTTSYASLLSFQLKDQFASMFSYCRSEAASRESLSFLLSLIAFGQPCLKIELQTLLAIATQEDLKELFGPGLNSYNLEAGHVLNNRTVTTLINEFEHAFVPTSTSLPSSSGSDDESDDGSRIIREREEFEAECNFQKGLIRKNVKDSWPSTSVKLPTRSTLTHFDITGLTHALNGRLSEWKNNLDLLRLLNQYDAILTRVNGVASIPPMAHLCLVQGTTRSAYPYTQLQLSLLTLMRSVQPTEAVLPSSPGFDSILDTSISQNASIQPEFLAASRKLETMLDGVVNDVRRDSSRIAQNYGTFLGDSVVALQKRNAAKKSHRMLPTKEILEEKLKDAQGRVKTMRESIRQLLRPQSSAEKIQAEAGTWPAITDLALLQLLSVVNRDLLPKLWFKVLVSFGCEITSLQRIERMMRYLDDDDKFALENEVKNEAHGAWDVEEFPDWLLLEIQNEMLIRPVQIRVAMDILKRENGVILLGMGEGKTSIILPMVITYLTTQKELIRVVVMKSLATEMLETLSYSLSGLVGRTVIHLPFSRKTSVDGSTCEMLKRMYQECQEQHGVLLTLPEHLNSFRLIGTDKLSRDETDVAGQLLALQKWLDDNARDIIDESDENLKPSWELVYTNGEAKLLTGAPHRWLLALEVLSLVRKDIFKVRQIDPHCVECEDQGTASYPHVRILNEKGAKLLLGTVAQDILDGQLDSIPLGNCNAAQLKAIKIFITEKQVEDATLKTISHHFSGSTKLDDLFVIRGLLVFQVLELALQKRWLVNYGLDRSRILSAVPYRAKSVPSQSAEFAQPDTLILLTALAYYYTGLEISDVKSCLVLLIKSIDSSDEYSRWIRDSDLPTKYRSINAVNLDDSACVEELHRYFQFNQSVIDYFLRLFVFPKEAKEFSHKLSSSAWDLCSGTSRKITSGFSGTSDNHLPLMIKEKNLSDLKHTTAAVLVNLLRDANQTYVCASDAQGQRLLTDNLLQLVAKLPQRPSVIIDVGAQFLESNKDMALNWLHLDPNDKKAAIFFSDDDEKMIVDKDGRVEKLMSSPFKDKFSDCLIYLDEFHTRGTDFRLPDDFVAAVMLGPGLQKDALVQGCMRMRKLAQSQRVVFIAPPEVDNNIRALIGEANRELNSLDVVKWSIHNSCLELKKQYPLHLDRGFAHCQRSIANAAHVEASGRVRKVATYLKTLKERESRPVSEMYQIPEQGPRKLAYTFSAVDRTDDVVRSLLTRWKEENVTESEHSRVDEEQEREVLHEVEQEREVQRPPHVDPCRSRICVELLDAIREGRLPNLPLKNVRPAFDILEMTSVAEQYRDEAWPSHVLCTDDFMCTVELPVDCPADNFLREVQWVLKFHNLNLLFLISPYEANKFKNAVQSSTNATLFIYSAKTIRTMASFDALDIQQIPECTPPVSVDIDLLTTLRLFSGQLYFNNFDEYSRTCELLGLWDGKRHLKDATRKVGNDNFVSPLCRKMNGWKCAFNESPVEIVKKFIGMRAKGREWAHTHMGRVLAGRILTQEELDEGNGVN